MVEADASEKAQQFPASKELEQILMQLVEKASTSTSTVSSVPSCQTWHCFKQHVPASRHDESSSLTRCQLEELASSFRLEAMACQHRSGVKTFCVVAVLYAVEAVVVVVVVLEVEVVVQSSSRSTTTEFPSAVVLLQLPLQQQYRCLRIAVAPVLVVVVLCVALQLFLLFLFVLLLLLLFSCCSSCACCSCCCCCCCCGCCFLQLFFCQAAYFGPG